MKKYEIDEYVGNSGFAVKENGVIIAQFQGHFYADAQTRGPAFYQMFEYRGERIDDQDVFFQTQRGAFIGLSENLAAESQPFQNCEACDTLLVRKTTDDITCCFTCGVVINRDGSLA